MISCLLITTKGKKSTKSGGLASSAHFVFFAVDLYRPDDPCVIQPDVRTPKVVSGLGLETAKGGRSAKPVGFFSVGAGTALFSFVHFVSFVVKHDVRHLGPVCRSRCPA